jgi:hypothetical protein
MRKFFPVLESRNICVEKNLCKFEAENLLPFCDTVPALENWENK